jgi:hypothetical protein
MDIEKIIPPRHFKVGNIELSHTANVLLKTDELVTFRTETSKEYDVVRKNWGYYATPSLNNRLANQGFRPLLARNSSSNYYILLVEKGKEKQFESYMRKEKMQVVVWLDDQAQLDNLNRGTELEINGGNNGS